MVSSDEIKEYIQKYGNDYSRESITSRLIQYGALEEDINRTYLQIENSKKEEISNKKNFHNPFLVLSFIVLLVAGGFSFFIVSNEEEICYECLNPRNLIEKETLVCNSDLDCNDNITSTKDICWIERNVCVNVPIDECVNDDNFCPAICTSRNDNDCTGEYYLNEGECFRYENYEESKSGKTCTTTFNRYNNSYYGFYIEYPDSWQKSESLLSNEVEFSKRNASFTVTIKDINENDSDENLESIGNNIAESFEYFFPGIQFNKGFYSDYFTIYNNNLLDMSYYAPFSENSGLKGNIRIYFKPELKKYFMTHQLSLGNITGKDARGVDISRRVFPNFNQTEKDEFEFLYRTFRINNYFEDKRTLDKPFLWKVSKKGNNDSYIFGTIHLTDDALYRFNKNMSKILNSSDAVYTEIVSNQAVSNILQKELILSEEEFLSELLPKDLYKRLEEYISSKGGNLFIFNKTKIWAVAISLGDFLKVKKVNNYNDILDSYISGIAVNNLQEIGSLEKPNEHFAFFNNLSIDEQIYYLEETLNEIEIYDRAGQDPGKNLVDLYLLGDEDNLAYFIFNEINISSSSFDKKFYEDLLIKRNNVMADRITSKLIENPSKQLFFTMGVAHLLNEGNILEILEDRGYKIERVQ